MAVLAATALVALGPGVAYADDPQAPVDRVVGDVEKEVAGQQKPVPNGPASGPGTGSSASNTQVAADPAAEDTTDQSTADQSTGTSGGRSSSAGGDTGRGDRVHAQVAKVAVGDQAVVDVGRGAASMQGNGRSNAHATALALFGQEIVGTGADSRGEKESHAGDPLAPLCERSGGSLCLRVLYADAAAEERGRSTTGRSQSGVASACLGGSSTDAWSECDGQVSAEVATSEAEMRRTDGRTRGSSASQLADVCIGRDGRECALGLTLLQAASKAFWDGRSEGSSTTGRLSLGGEEVGAYGDPTDVSMQPECTAPSLVCVLLNQGGGSIEDDQVKQAQDALDVGVLPDTVGVYVGVSNTGVSVTHGGVLGNEEDREGGDDGAGAGGAGGPGAPGTVAGVARGVLPDTGGVWSGLAALALAACGAGSLLVARNRRRLGATG